MKQKKYQHLSSEERFVIEVMYRGGAFIRRIALILGRSPNTISREVQNNAVNGTYHAKRAGTKACQRRWRAKSQCLKVALHAFLTVFVEEKLAQRWSPKQISGYLKREFALSCSAKAVYKFAESRCLEHLLFWGWNTHKGGRKRYTHAPAHDGRALIDARPSLVGHGHMEMDFIVSKHSSAVLLVVVDRVTKRTWVRQMPNRKRSTVRRTC